MPLIFGIDPSSKKLALCITTTFDKDEVPELHTISLPAGVSRATGHAYREAFLFFQYYRPGDIHVYLEAPLVGRSAYATIVQAQVGGAVMAAAANCDMPVHLVNVSSWKKKVLGKGNANKEQVSELLQGVWPEAYNAASGDQDLIDACCINRFGVANQRLAKAILTRSRSARKAQD